MKWRKWTAWLMMSAAAFSLLTALQKGEQPAMVRLLRVERGDVEQIAALTGRMAYQGEQMVFSAAPGIVSQLYVASGDRVAAGEALMRLDSGAQDAAAAALLALDEPLIQPESFLNATVIRAPDSSTVRQVFTACGAAVAAGTPVIRLSSGEQEIRCAALEADGHRIRPGMNADIQCEGENIGTAEVISVSEAVSEPETGRLIREIRLIPSDHVALPEGAAVEVDVVLAEGRRVPVLPVEAIGEDGTVWQVNDGRCTKIPAEIILSDEMHAWVNLPEGMLVAIGELEEGQRVAEVKP